MVRKSTHIYRFFPYFIVQLSLILLLIAPQSPLLAQDKENAEFKLAVGLYNDGMYDLAIEQFKNFINAYPNTSNSIEARLYLGTTQMKLKRYDEARVTFQNFALTYVEHPKAPEAWINVGDAFLALNNEREAASAYERVKVFHPKSQLVPEALFKAAKIERRIGDRENAKKNLRTIVQDYPNSSSVLPARLAIGEMYAEEGQTELAEREARRVAESDAPAGVKAGALFSLGKLQMMTGLFDDAEATFKSIINGYKNTPAVSPATFELGTLQMGTRNYAVAIENFKKAASDDAADDSLQAEGYFETGRAYLLLKEYGNAKKSFEKLLAKFPSSPFYERALYEAGHAALLNDDNKEGLQYAKKIITLPLSPLKGVAILLAADASIALKQFTDAVYYLSTFLDEFPDNPLTPDITLRLARLYGEQLQDYRKAINIYDQATQRYPQLPRIVEAILGSARCEEQLGDIEGALKTYNNLQTHYPVNDLYDSISQKIEYLQHHKMRDRDGGIEKLARLMGEVLTNKSKAELSFKLGEIYFHDLKDYDAAAQQFTTAIDNGLDESKFIDAYFYRARAFHFLSELNPDATAQAITYYDAYLKQFPKSKWSDDAQYFSYLLRIKKSEPVKSIALAQDFLAKNTSSPYRDRVLFDLGTESKYADAFPDALQIFGLIVQEFPASTLPSQPYPECRNPSPPPTHPDSAQTCWQRVLSYPVGNPSTVNALWNLADLQWQNKNYPEVITLWKRIAGEFFYTSSGEKAGAMLPEAYIANGEYDEAIALYLASLAKARQTSPTGEIANSIYFNLAVAYDKKGERQTATRYYFRYLADDRTGPYASKAFYALGGFARAQGKMNNASSYFKQAAALGETGSTSRDIADLLFETEQYTDAARQYMVLAQSTDSLEAKKYYQSRAIIATFRMNKLNEAQKMSDEFEKSYKDIESFQAEFVYEKGHACYTQQDYAAAKKLFEKVAGDYDETRVGPWAYYYLGKISEVTDKLEDAAKRYEQILKKFPTADVIPRVLLSLGNMHFNAERYEESIRYYQQITKMPEKAGDVLPFAMGNLIEAYESTKMYDDALKTTRDFIERFPNDESIIDKKIKLGTLYSKIGYYDQAVLHFQNLIPEAGSLVEAELRYDIGEAYYFKGDFQQAILEFLKVPYLVTKQGKVNWTATSLYMAGQSYEKMSKFDEAVGMYEQIINRPGIDATFKAAARKEIDRVKSIIKKGSN